MFNKKRTSTQNLSDVDIFDDVIQKAYEDANVPSDDESIYRLSQILSTFPSEAPDSIKKPATLNLLNVFGIEASTLCADGKARLGALTAKRKDIEKKYIEEEKKALEVYKQIEKERENLDKKEEEVKERIYAMKLAKDNASTRISVEKGIVAKLLNYLE